VVVPAVEFVTASVVAAGGGVAVGLAAGAPTAGLVAVFVAGATAGAALLVWASVGRSKSTPDCCCALVESVGAGDEAGAGTGTGTGGALLLKGI
jgi:hypothetical protein